MLIDCESCSVRGEGCAGCLVTALYEPPVEVDLLTRDELWAIETLSRAGFDVTVLEPEPAAPPARRPLRLVGRRDVSGAA
jgi:hypothetical protein